MKRNCGIGLSCRFRLVLFIFIMVTATGFFSVPACWSGADDGDVHTVAGKASAVQTNNGPVQGDEGMADLDDWEELDESAEVWDPFESFNRYMFTFNDRLYFWGLKPVATAYTWVMPEPLRESVYNGWQNLSTPVRVANCLLQLKFKDAGVEVARFFINSIMGIGGLGDPAERMFDLHRADEDLGQTFATWGVGFGPYLVLPFIGPSCPRDAIGLLGDSYLYPLNYYIGKFWQNAAIRVGKEVNLRSLRLGEYEDFKAASLDPYVAARSAYFQYRKNAVENSSDYFKSFTMQ